jgi:hypothetical protein
MGDSDPRAQHGPERVPAYQRPQPSQRLTGAERDEFLRRYYEEYAEIAAARPDSLNVKVPRTAFHDLVDRIGAVLLSVSADLAREHGPVRDFLEQHSLPESLEGRIPQEYRAFCLALNALKQWVNAEQAATDRYLVGGDARAAFRAAASTCVASGKPLDLERVDLHHPLRDGRPPIPLDRDAHAEIEGQDRRQKRSGTATRGKRARKARALEVDEDGVHTYRAGTLTFLSSVIESLADDDAFRVITSAAVYRMTRAEFYASFPNVTASRSYREIGRYSYTKAPAKAAPFVEVGRADDTPGA